MEEGAELLDDRARQQIERLQLVARTIVQSFVTGQHRSASQVLRPENRLDDIRLELRHTVPTPDTGEPTAPGSRSG